MQTIVKCLFVLTIVFVNLVTPVSAAYYEPEIVANSSILINADSGVILTGQDIDEQFGIASLTKLMSMYVAFDIIAEKDIPLDTMVPISERVSVLKAESPEASGVWYNAGQEVPLEQLIELSLIYSDNSAIMAISEYLSGSEQAHVDAMNAKAKELGMTKSQFYNVSGLTMSDLGSAKLEGTSDKDYNVSSARDMSTMIYHMIQDYPETLEVTSKTTVEYNNEVLNSWNQMLPDMLLEYEGVSGLKTGTSEEAKYCFAGYYTDPDGRNFISVVLGADDSNERFYQTSYLYDWEQELKYNTFIEKSATKEFNVPKSSKGKYLLHPISDVELIDANSPQLMLEKIEFNEEYFDEEGMMEDIPAGEKVLSVHYKVINEDDASQMRSVEGEDGYLVVDYTSDTNIERQNALTLLITAIPNFFSSLFEGIL